MDALVIFGVILLVAILIREFWCWFYKSNKILKNTEIALGQLEHLSKEIEKLSERVDYLSRK